MDYEGAFDGWNYLQKEIFRLPRDKHFDQVLQKREEVSKIRREVARKK